jgi:hypothetical protein
MRGFTPLQRLRWLAALYAPFICWHMATFTIDGLTSHYHGSGACTEDDCPYAAALNLTAA